MAGVAGAWSPCGFSMVETIGSAMGDRQATGDVDREHDLHARCDAGWPGDASVASRCSGALLDPGAGGVREAIGAVIALAAAIADWRGVRIAPQIRRQVPERWRWTQPLPLACGLYGILLGLGFTTFVLAFAVWALAGISLRHRRSRRGSADRGGLRRWARSACAADGAVVSQSGQRCAATGQRSPSSPACGSACGDWTRSGWGCASCSWGAQARRPPRFPRPSIPPSPPVTVAWQQLSGPAVLRLPTGHT